MAEKLPPLPFDGTAFYADPAIAVLTPEEEAAVHRLRWYQWRHGFLPADAGDLERMIGRPVSARVLALFPVVSESQRVNLELARERDATWSRRAKMRTGGSRGRRQQLTGSRKRARRTASQPAAGSSPVATPEAGPMGRPGGSPESGTSSRNSAAQAGDTSSPVATPTAPPRGRLAGGPEASPRKSAGRPSKAVDLFAPEGTPGASPAVGSGAPPAPLVPPLSPTPPISPLNPPSPGTNLAADAAAAEGPPGTASTDADQGEPPIGRATSWPARFAEILTPIGEFHPARVGKALAIVRRRYGEERTEEMLRAYAEHGPHLRNDGQIDPDHDAPQFCTPERFAGTAGFWFRYTEPIASPATGSRHAPPTH